MIDHTLLRPDATMTEIEQLCREAVTLDMASVCVNGTWVATCADLLRNSGVNVCTVVGFPLGAMATEAKAHEAQVAAEQGATEIDMVLNIGAVKDANWTLVTSDIAAVVAAAPRSLIKVILETALLTDDEIVAACRAAVAGGAHFVKTSTGFAGAGASIEAVALMRQTVGNELGVKASGGIHTPTQLNELISAGATRIGSSAGQALLERTER